jgi:hypothetical protein
VCHTVPEKYGSGQVAASQTNVQCIMLVHEVRGHVMREVALGVAGGLAALVVPSNFPVLCLPWA